MEIQQRMSPHGGKFFGEIDGKQLALLLYKQENNRMMIVHTEVDSSLQGQGIAHQLLEKAIEYARANQLTVVPMCAFARAEMEKTNSYDDVLGK